MVYNPYRRASVPFTEAEKHGENISGWIECEGCVDKALHVLDNKKSSTVFYSIHTTYHMVVRPYAQQVGALASYYINIGKIVGRDPVEGLPATAPAKTGGPTHSKQVPMDDREVRQNHVLLVASTYN